MDELSLPFKSLNIFPRKNFFTAKKVDFTTFSYGKQGERPI